MGAIVPGGTRADLADSGARRLAICVRELADEALTLRAIYDEHEGVRDRFTGAGAVAPELAARLGLTGLAGRASAQAFDLRIDLPCEPYAQLTPATIGRSEGDVAARVAVRFDELQESCRLIRRILRSAPDGASPCPSARARRWGRGSGTDRGLARSGVRRARSGSIGRDPPLSPARSVVAELARARARHHRQHRPGFPAHQ